MICIVIGARKFGVNPDNIATPIAASLGDLITLSILALISSFFYRHRGRGGAEERRGPTQVTPNLSGSWSVILKEGVRVLWSPSLQMGAGRWGSGGQPEVTQQVQDGWRH